MGWFSRSAEPAPRRSSFGGAIVGLAMFCGAASLMFWNESRTAQQTNALSELEKVVVEVKPKPIDSSKEGKAVHVIGQATTSVGAIDPVFAVGDGDTLKIERIVSMYQWEKKGSKKNRNWEKNWSTSQESGDSSHPNPEFPIYGEAFMANDVKLGAFDIGGEVIEELGGTDLSVSAEMSAELADQGWRAENNGYFLGSGSYGNPQVGDVYVRFEGTREGSLSVIGMQRGSQIGAYTAKNGVSLMLAENGAMTTPALLASARSSNSVMAYVLRGVGTFGMTISLGIFFSSLVSFLGRIPLIGPLIEKFAFGVGALIGFICAVVVFVSAWLYAHPIWLVATLIAIAGLIYWVMMRKRNRNQNINMPPPPPPPSMPPPGMMPPPFQR